MDRNQSTALIAVMIAAILLVAGYITGREDGQWESSRIQFFLMSGMGLAVFGILLSLERRTAAFAFLLIFYGGWFAFVL